MEVYRYAGMFTLALCEGGSITAGAYVAEYLAPHVNGRLWVLPTVWFLGLGGGIVAGIAAYRSWAKAGRRAATRAAQTAAREPAREIPDGPAADYDDELLERPEFPFTRWGRLEPPSGRTPKP
jgi:hypothetical protein